MASLHRRPNSPFWQIRYRDPRGKVRRTSSGTEVEAHAWRIAEDLERPWRLKKEGLISPAEALRLEQDDKPLETHLEEYLAELRRLGRSARTIEVYEHGIRWVVERCGAERLSDLTLEAVTHAIAELEAAGKSAATRRLRGQTVHGFLAWAERVGRLVSNPLRHLARPDVEGDRRRERRPLTDEEVERLYRVADERGRGLFYRLAFMAGLRRGEILRLRWEDIDLDAGLILVRRGKSRRDEVVPIRPALLQTLCAASGRRFGGRVVPRSVSDRTRRRDYYRASIEEQDPRGLYADLHSARMTLHHQLIRSGAPPQVCQAILRHRSYATTERHYSRLGDLRSAYGLDPLRTAMDRLEGPDRESDSESASG